MPTTVISISGRVRHIRPLPSDSTTTSVPVSATAKLAPETATLARRNFSRRCSRAAPASIARVVGEALGRGTSGAAISRGRSPGSPRGCGGWPAPGCARAGRRPAARSARRGRSPRRRCPCSASASLSPISWVAIDLTLTTSSAPVRLRDQSATIALASAASRAQCTVPPRAVSAGLELDRGAGRGRAARTSLIAAPASRSSSQSSTSADRRAARLSRIVCGGVGQVAAQLGVGRARRRVGNGCAAKVPACRRTVPQVMSHVAPVEARISARCIVRTPERCREQHPADVHQAGVVAGDQHLGAGLADVPGLVGAHRHRGVGVLDREGAAEAAALLRGRQVDQLDAPDRLAAAAAAGRRRAAAAASGRSGGRSPGAGSRRPRRSRRARRRGTR